MPGPLNGRGDARGGRGRAGELEAAACKVDAARDERLEGALLAMQVRQGGRPLSGATLGALRITPRWTKRRRRARRGHGWCGQGSCRLGSRSSATGASLLAAHAAEDSA